MNRTCRFVQVNVPIINQFQLIMKAGICKGLVNLQMEKCFKSLFQFLINISLNSFSKTMINVVYK